uniref:Uncharacterized protein n=1 Tax=Anopheles farauti TaxID=69004 RepID=A0A182QWQ8_9DIPT
MVNHSTFVWRLFDAPDDEQFPQPKCAATLHFGPPPGAGRCGHGSPCEQLCYELHDGMYECDCSEGFELNKNGYSCQVAACVKPSELGMFREGLVWFFSVRTPSSLRIGFLVWRNQYAKGIRIRGAANSTGVELRLRIAVTSRNTRCTTLVSLSSFFELYGQLGHRCEHPIGVTSASPASRSSCPMWAAKCHLVGLTAIVSDKVVDLPEGRTIDRRNH